MARSPHILMLLAATAGLGACSGKSADTDANGEGMASKAAASTPLGTAIVIDPARIGKAGSPPPGAGARATCTFANDRAWAQRLPAELPIYPGARLQEAAGSDAAGCRRRIVSFATAATSAQIVAFYTAKASAAGYSAEHLVEQGNDVLGGTKGDAAYYLTVTPAKGGATVDLVVNSG